MNNFYGVEKLTWKVFTRSKLKAKKGDLRTEEPRSKIQTVLREFYRELKVSINDGSIDSDTLREFYDNVIDVLYKETIAGTRGDAPFSKFLLELESELPIEFERLYSKNGVNKSFEQVCELLEREPEHFETIYKLIEKKYPNLVLPPSQRKGKTKKLKERGEKHRGEKIPIKIGKNELEIMRLLREHDGLQKRELRKLFNPKGDKTVALSRAISSLSEKGLIAKLARINTYERWHLIDKDGNSILMGHSYDGNMRGPYVTVFFGLTQNGYWEIDKRERYR